MIATLAFFAGLGLGFWQFFDWSEWRGGTRATGPTFLIKRLCSFRGRVVQIHKFLQADEPGCFHSHPAFAVRIVLWGGYFEETAAGELIEWKPLRAGIVRPEFEHRIHAVRNGRSSLSLWLRGKKVAPINVRGCT